MYCHGQYVRSGGRELPGSETRVGGLGMGEERLDHGARAASSLTASCVSQAAMMQARGRTEQRPRDPSDPIQMAQ
jgi:hypothetical protein